MSKIRIVESDHSQLEMDITKEKELNDLLYTLLKDEARVVILELPDFGIFTLGIGLPYGFVQFSKDGDSPYLVVSSKEITSGTISGNEIEFDSGGTPTPIPADLCLPYERVVEIIKFCFTNQELPKIVEWEEI